MGRMNRDRPASRRRADEVFAARPQRREERERYRLHLGRTPPLNGPRRQPSSRSSDPPSPPLQRIRTPLRTSGGRFFYEGEGVERGDGAVEAAADVGRHELEANRAEEGAKHLS